MKDFLFRLVKTILSKYSKLNRLDDILVQQYFLFFERQNLNNCQKEFKISEFIHSNGLVINPSGTHGSTALAHIKYLMPRAVFSHRLADVPQADAYFVWGNLYSKRKVTHAMLAQAVMRGKLVYILEDGFFKSATTWADIGKPLEYRCGVSFTIDDLACYYDSLFPSRLEIGLNSERQLSPEAHSRARTLIDFIIQHKITKYNHQPIFKPTLGRSGVRKVLVIDQSYNDFSIIRCQANDLTFKRMLHAAFNENPDADIIIKTHPDTISNPSERSGYYTTLKNSDRLFTLREAINPISLLQNVDKVYVCSSQMGFEALMCNCDVVTFGMPFYAGWGLTDDRHPGFSSAEMLARRNKQRSLEEVFYFAYLWYSFYVDPTKRTTCELEDALQYLLKIREDFFRTYKVRYEK